MEITEEIMREFEEQMNGNKQPEKTIEQST